MKHGTPTALLLAALVAACATPPAAQQAAEAPRPPVAETAPEPEQAPPARAMLSAALRARLAESGAQFAAVDDDSVRLTLPGAIVFASGSKSVSQPAQPILARIAEALAAHPGWRVLVEGHTDSIGRELFNEELSRQRAESVVGFLAARGLDAGKLAAIGRGERVPIADNATEKGRAANRRIDIIVSPAAD